MVWVNVVVGWLFGRWGGGCGGLVAFLRELTRDLPPATQLQFLHTQMSPVFLTDGKSSFISFQRGWKWLSWWWLVCVRKFYLTGSPEFWDLCTGPVPLVKLVVGSCHKDCSYDEGKSNLFVTVRKAGDDRRPPACILHSDSHRENYTSVTNGFWNFWVYNVHTTVQIGVYLACDHKPKVTHNQQCWTFYTTVLMLNTKIS